MKLNSNNPNPSIDEQSIDQALLDEALAEAKPAELEAKILALTDRSMLSLLDEVLAPEPASDALTQRILAATQPSQHEAPAVLTRIGPATLRYAAAAAIVLAVGLGVWYANHEAGDGVAQIAGVTDNLDSNNANTAEVDPAWLTDEQYATNTNFFDTETKPIESTLSNLAQSIDDVSISRDTLWAELDAYEQFLDDFES